MQSLILLNDPQFVEASRVLAERMQREGGDALEEQLTYGFRALSGRFPTKEELNVLENLFEEEHTRFKNTPEEASSLLSVGERRPDPSLDQPKTAALAIAANTILNLDASYMKR